MASAAGDAPPDQHDEALVAHVGATSAGAWVLDATDQALLHAATAGGDPHPAGPVDDLTDTAAVLGELAGEGRDDIVVLAMAT